uniref:Uncharacterized protein n=1 Tax=Astyanax mexicanus TaxID=7994 RepID=W5KGW7_ASTMX
TPTHPDLKAPLHLRQRNHIFDNEEFDCRTPEDWLALGFELDSTDHKPVPAKALLPTSDNISDTGTEQYMWQSVGVLDYCPEKKQYLVQKADPLGRIRDRNGKPAVPGAQRNKDSLLAGQFWVPRIRLMFCAEDPRIFAQRVQFALNSRKTTEAMLLYNLCVDCMPFSSVTPTLDPTSLQRIRDFTLSTPERMKRLEKEVELHYNRTMNKLSFDWVVQNKPEEFSYITLPQEEPESVPQSVEQQFVLSGHEFATAKNMRISTQSY